MEHTRWLLLKMVEEFLINSNLTLEFIRRIHKNSQVLNEKDLYRLSIIEDAKNVNWSYYERFFMQRHEWSFKILQNTERTEKYLPSRKTKETQVAVNREKSRKR